jgi:hypothetical protein
LKAVYTITRAVSFVDLPIISCQADLANGVITVQASAENLSDELFAGNQSASVALYISDENNSVTSSFVELVLINSTGATIIPSNEIWYTTVTGEILQPYYSTVFDAPIVSNTYEDGKGIIKFGSTLTEIKDEAFANCVDLVTLTMPNTVTKIGSKAFYNCHSLISIGMSEAIVSIGASAFDATGLQSIVIPDGVTSLNSMVFSSCEYLTDVTLSKNIKSISDRAFMGCSRLAHIELPESLSSISYWAFGNTAISEITIPSGITSIQESVFSNTLTKVYCKAVNPPKALKYSSVAKWSGLGLNSQLVIYVPTESVSAYKKASYWSEYADRIIGYDF